MPNASRLIHVDRPLGGLGVRLCTYRRELNGVAVYQSFVAWPWPPDARSGLRMGDPIRAVSCCRLEGVLMGYEHPAVAVCLLGPGSAGPVPAQRCIASLGDLAEALEQTPPNREDRPNRPTGKREIALPLFDIPVSDPQPHESPRHTEQS